jgi:subtilisin
LIRKFGFLITAVATMLIACAGAVVAQQGSNEADDSESVSGLQESSARGAGGRVIPGEYIVVLKDEAEQSAQGAERGRVNAAQVASELTQEKSVEEVSHVYQNALKGFAGKIPQGKVEEVRSDPRVEFVAQDREVRASAQTLPNGVNRVEADVSPTAQAGNGSGAVDADIAVIDSGIDKAHTDLNVAGGYNCTTKDKRKRKNFSDGNGHGTHVAGTAAAKDDGAGVVGTAPGARLWGMKVLNTQGSGKTSWVICGIDKVTATKQDSDPSNDIQVANMSLGATAPFEIDDGNCGRNIGDAEHVAVCNSVASGITYVVAAGNGGSDDIGDNFKFDLPASYNEVLTVTATADSNGQPGGTWSRPAGCNRDSVEETVVVFSNFTTKGHSDENHTIAAPGRCILSTWPTKLTPLSGNPTGYNTISGTSMASPHVAGTAALCIASSSTTGKCSGGPSDVISDLRSDAQAKTTQTSSYGFAEDPRNITTTGSKYYGFLEFAGGY